MNIEGTPKKHILGRLMKFAAPFAGSLIFAMLLVLTTEALGLYMPIILGDVIDMFVAGSEYALILRKGIIYLIVLAVMCILYVGQSWLLQYNGQKIVYNVRRDLFTHIHKLHLGFFDVTPVGKLVTRVTNDVESLSEVFSTILVHLIKDVIKILGLAAIMLILNKRLALMAFVLVPFIVVLTFLFKKMSRTAYRITRTKLTAVNVFLSEHLSGMRLIQTFAKEPEKNAAFREKSGELYKANFREVMVFAVFRPSIIFLANIALANIISKGSGFVFDGMAGLEGGITVGTLYIFIQYVSSFFEPIQELAEQLGTLQQAFASSEKIFAILDEDPAIVSPAVPVSPEHGINGRIEFSHVWFAYTGEDWVLRDVSFVIEPGQKVAFVGATGAGKTTILSLVGRYYDIQKGSITIDGVDIRLMNTDELRRAIGQVQQDVFVFTGDIAGNIRLLDDSITDEQIREAAHTANADQFIEKLEHGYEEAVTERGSTLSAGQRQLLSFARTLAYDPKILVMDEATANIDTETELLITEALERLMNGRTTIMVAHRLSTIQHCDTIMVMHKGRLREQGTHLELLAQNGIYRKLYEIQQEHAVTG